MSDPIHCNLQYKLPQKNGNEYNELFISVLAQFFPINLSIHCYYAIKTIEMLK
jgi:hypothetical protein